MYNQALELYEQACGLLQLADSEPGAEVQAEVALQQAIALLHEGETVHKKKKQRTSSKDNDADEAKALLSELQLLLGRVVESKDPVRGLAAYQAAWAIESDRAETNLHLGRLLWKCAASKSSMATAEARIRDAAQLAENDGDEEGWRDAQELLGRLLLQDGRDTEAHAVLRPLGYTHAFASSLASLKTTAGPLSGTKLLASQCASEAVNAVDSALTPAMLAQMRRALAYDASYWAENNYNSPRTGFFSFQHKLPSFKQALGRQGQPTSHDLDAVLQHIWVVAAERVPALRQARYCEWWAHARPHCYGHQLHFDSLPG